MDELRFGTAIRMARIRRELRQADLAAKARVSRGTVSRIERGLIHEVAFGAIARVGRALDVRVELLARSRGADLDRLLNARHAALAESVVGRVGRLEGWVVRPELSFSVFGERGIVDVLAWHEALRALLIIELKTEIVDVGELLGTLDRKRRLAADIGAPLGWRPRSVGSCLIVAESMTNRRRLSLHEATFRAAFPDDGRRARGWLRNPVGELRALMLVSDARRGSVRSGFAGVRRVSARGRVVRGPTLSSAKGLGARQQAAGTPDAATNSI